MVLQGRCGRHFEIVRDRMIKIIFSDMDGTLLDEHGNVPEGFDEIIAELEELEAEIQQGLAELKAMLS